MGNTDGESEASTVEESSLHDEKRALSMVEGGAIRRDVGVEVGVGLLQDVVEASVGAGLYELDTGVVAIDEVVVVEPSCQGVE